MNRLSGIPWILMAPICAIAERPIRLSHDEWDRCPIAAPILMEAADEAILLLGGGSPRIEGLRRLSEEIYSLSPDQEAITASLLGIPSFDREPHSGMTGGRRLRLALQWIVAIHDHTGAMP